MRRCLALAQEAADAGEAPVGAVVVQQGREIAAARNEREAACDVSAHAEILALRRAGAALGRWALPPGCTLLLDRVIRLVDLLHLLFNEIGERIPRIAVWMVLACQIAVRLLYFVVRRIASDAEHRIWIFIHTFL